MEEHRVRLLPVMEETGTLLGLISEARILEAWEVDPLQTVSEVMAECGPPWVDEADEREWYPTEVLNWEQQAHGS